MRKDRTDDGKICYRPFLKSIGSDEPIDLIEIIKLLIQRKSLSRLSDFMGSHSCLVQSTLVYMDWYRRRP